MAVAAPKQVEHSEKWEQEPRGAGGICERQHRRSKESVAYAVDKNHRGRISKPYQHLEDGVRRGAREWPTIAPLREELRSRRRTRGT
jgi:hypothetical protein